MAWEYAEWSKKAKEAGGPNELATKIEEGGRQKGRDEMKPYIVVASTATALITFAITKAISLFKDKKAMAQIESEKAKEELVQRLEGYDNEHQDDEQVLAQKIEDDEYTEYDEDGFDDSEAISVDEAALIWASNGKDEDYTFGYSEYELEKALK